MVSSPHHHTLCRGIKCPNRHQKRRGREASHPPPSPDAPRRLETDRGQKKNLVFAHQITANRAANRHRPATNPESRRPEPKLPPKSHRPRAPRPRPRLDGPDPAGARPNRRARASPDHDFPRMDGPRGGRSRGNRRPRTPPSDRKKIQKKRTKQTRQAPRSAAPGRGSAGAYIGGRRRGRGRSAEAGFVASGAARAWGTRRWWEGGAAENGGPRQARQEGTRGLLWKAEAAVRGPPPLSRLGLERDGAVSRGRAARCVPMKWSEWAPGRGAVRLAGGPAREAGGWGRPVRVRLFLAASG
ncbi:hypothetical protein PVAP13_2KG057416 [Panicum virgatum]|uniref:Uncharacterized protein n=1 Tax=Panicum virgatum TaxID=38727 RepID=A0A8T0W4A2_PANVG|nr:hypothetical protein PVAP13_2KG057416 [Panicum virgatum]